jgi:glycosyltransferase involved in cell wall biosynthesis
MNNQLPLRVLSISQYGSGLLDTAALSGALARQKEYAARLSSYTVLVPDGKGGNPIIAENLTILPIPAGNPLAFLVGAYQRACELHAEMPFDLIMVDNPHLASVLGIFLKYRLKIPLVVHSMADMIFNPWYVRERFSNRLKHILMRIAVAYTDVVRVSTAFECERLVTRGVPREKIAVVPFYVDTVDFSLTLSQVPVLRDHVTILFVGRLSYQKDLPTLLAAMKEVKEHCPAARLRIVGSGELDRTLHAYAASESVADVVTFTGAIPYAAIAKEFKKATVFVLPSLYEGTCMVLHEAALAGLPLVSTEVAGAHDFIRDGVEGFLVPVRDPHALSVALIKVLNDAELQQKLGEASTRRMAAFTKEKALTAFSELCTRFV